MIILWDHSYGKQEQQHLVVCRPLGIPESYEEAEMITGGWLASDRPIWHEGRWQEAFYQSRSTRVRLHNYRRPTKEKQYLYNGRPIQMMEIRPEKNFLRWTGLQQVYDAYLKRTGYRDLYNPLTHINARDTFLLYYQDELTNLIGFTKIKRYWWQEDIMSLSRGFDDDDAVGDPDQCLAIESVMHANTVPISKITLEMELAWAKRKGCDYFYMGSGYEKSSIYKAHVPGFQWWTGTTWSSNKKRYIALCERDSKISKIQDLAK
jgi:hypothetical protein